MHLPWGQHRKADRAPAVRMWVRVVRGVLADAEIAALLSSERRKADMRRAKIMAAGAPEFARLPAGRVDPAVAGHQSSSMGAGSSHSHDRCRPQ